MPDKNLLPARLTPEEITEALNRVADSMETRSDPFVRAAATAALARSEWSTGTSAPSASQASPPGD